MNCLKVQDVPIAYFEDFMEMLSIINFLFVDFYVQLLDSRNIMKLALFASKVNEKSLALLISH